MREAEKLRILLDHWIGHSAEHGEEFEKWAQQARSAGLEEVSLRLSEAAASSREAVRHLRDALSFLDDSKGKEDVPE